jgi:hypothetical protein
MLFLMTWICLVTYLSLKNVKERKKEDTTSIVDITSQRGWTQVF